MTGRDSTPSGMSAAVSVRDARLVGPAIASWLAVFLALHTTARVVWAAAVGALMLAGCCAWWVSGPWLLGARNRGPLISHATRPRRRWWWLAVLAAMAAGLASCAWQLSVRDTSEVRAAAVAQRSMPISATVSSDPRRIEPPQPRPRYVVDATARGGVRIVVVGTGDAWGRLLPGQRIRFRADVTPPFAGALVAAVARADGRPVLLGAPPWHQRWAGGVRTALVAGAVDQVPQPAAGLVPALSVGDTSAMSAATVAAFRDSGLTHLTAVSGANLAIVVGAVAALIRRLGGGPRLVALLALGSIVAFVVLARPQPSVLRAAVMAGIALLALVIGRPRAALPALGTAVIALIVVDPALAADAGFALSVSATAGLILLAPRWRAALVARRVPGGLADVLAATGAAQLACSPILVALGDGLNLVAIPANLVAALAVPAVTLLGIVAAGLVGWWPAGAGLLLWLAGWPARWIIAVAEFCAPIELGTLPWPSGLAGAAAVVLGATALWFACRTRLGRRLAAAGMAAIVGIVAVIAALPAPAWSLVVCDVGQGDAMLLRAGPRAAVVVDTGPDAIAVDRCLRRYRIRQVPLLILTHLHVDHVGGMAGVFRDRMVSTVISASGQDAGRLRQLRGLARRHGRAIAVVAPGWRVAVGSVRLRALGDETFRGTRSDANNNSLVLQARVSGATVLLAGDAEVEAQRSLLDDPGLLRADVLKAPHHGSAYALPEFYAAVQPRLVIVSVGANNRYGHPSRIVLASVRRHGARVMRTDRDGSCVVAFRGGQVSVVGRRA